MLYYVKNIENNEECYGFLSDGDNYDRSLWITFTSVDKSKFSISLPKIKIIEYDNATVKFTRFKINLFFIEIDYYKECWKYK